MSRGGQGAGAAADHRDMPHRTRFVMEKLVTHLHDFVREVSLTTEEWMQVMLSVRRNMRS